MSYIDDQIFINEDFSIEREEVKEYNNCTFKGCNFQMANMCNTHFIECEFIGCNMSNANINNTMFNNVTFKECKMLGLHFNDVNSFIFSVTFNNCQLDHSSFFKLKMIKTDFTETNLSGVDFSNTDLRGSTFTECNLLDTMFQQSNLEKVDFRSSYNYALDPEINKIKGAKFSLQSVTGLLRKHKITIDYNS